MPLPAFTEAFGSVSEVLYRKSREANLETEISPEEILYSDQSVDCADSNNSSQTWLVSGSFHVDPGSLCASDFKTTQVPPCYEELEESSPELICNNEEEIMSPTENDHIMISDPYMQNANHEESETLEYSDLLHSRDEVIVKFTQSYEIQDYGNVIDDGLNSDIESLYPDIADMTKQLEWESHACYTMTEYVENLNSTLVDLGIENVITYCNDADTQVEAVDLSQKKTDNDIINENYLSSIPHAKVLKHESSFPSNLPMAVSTSFRSDECSVSDKFEGSSDSADLCLVPQKSEDSTSLALCKYANNGLVNQSEACLTIRVDSSPLHERSNNNLRTSFASSSSCHAENIVGRMEMFSEVEKDSSIIAKFSVRELLDFCLRLQDAENGTVTSDNPSDAVPAIPDSTSDLGEIVSCPATTEVHPSSSSSASCVPSASLGMDGNIESIMVTSSGGVSENEEDDLKQGSPKERSTKERPEKSEAVGFKCGDCGRYYRIEKYFIRHKLLHALSTIKDEASRKKILEMQENLLINRKKKTTTKLIKTNDCLETPKSKQCNIQGKRFGMPTECYQHRCSNCDKTYKRREGLRRHLSKHPECRPSSIVSNATEVEISSKKCCSPANTQENIIMSKRQRNKDLQENHKKLTVLNDDTDKKFKIVDLISERLDSENSEGSLRPTNGKRKMLIPLDSETKHDIQALKKLKQTNPLCTYKYFVSNSKRSQIRIGYSQISNAKKQLKKPLERMNGDRDSKTKVNDKDIVKDDPNNYIRKKESSTLEIFTFKESDTDSISSAYDVELKNLKGKPEIPSRERDSELQGVPVKNETVKHCRSPISPSKDQCLKPELNKNNVNLMVESTVADSLNSEIPQQNAVEKDALTTEGTKRLIAVKRIGKRMTCKKTVEFKVKKNVVSESVKKVVYTRAIIQKKVDKETSVSEINSDASHLKAVRDSKGLEKSSEFRDKESNVSLPSGSSTNKNMLLIGAKELRICLKKCEAEFLPKVDKNDNVISGCFIQKSRVDEKAKDVKNPSSDVCTNEESVVSVGESPLTNGSLVGIVDLPNSESKDVKQLKSTTSSEKETNPLEISVVKTRGQKNQKVDFTPNQKVDFTPNQKIDFTPNQKVDFTPNQKIDFTPNQKIDFTPNQKVDFTPKLWPCDMCDKSYKHKGSLNRHKTKTHASFKKQDGKKV